MARVVYGASVWDVATGNRQAEISGKCTFAPDGKSVLSAAKDGLKLWDAATGKFRAWNSVKHVPWRVFAGKNGSG